jgi:hypothetical protein
MRKFVLPIIASLILILCRGICTAQEVHELVVASDGSVHTEPSVTLLEDKDFTPMGFDLERAFLTDGCFTIYASGRIVQDTAERLKSILEANQVHCGSIHLNSPGGDLVAGIVMGRLIRAHGLSTYVGKNPKGRLCDKVYGSGFQSFFSKGPCAGFDFIPGECDSSCNFAYMGGITREAFGDRNYPKHSNFGVHRFQFGGQNPVPPGSNDPNLLSPIEGAQLTSAQIVQYLQEMGVDPQFLTFMAGFRYVTFLPPSILKQLQITFIPSTTWEMVAAGGTYALEAKNSLKQDPDVLDLVCEPQVIGALRRLVATVDLAAPGHSGDNGTTSWSEYLSEWVPSFIKIRIFRGHAGAGEIVVANSDIIRPIRVDTNQDRITAAFALSPEVIDIIVDTSYDSFDVDVVAVLKDGRKTMNLGGGIFGPDFYVNAELNVTSMRLEVASFHEKIRQFIRACQ